MKRLKRKFAVFYVLISSLCFLTFALEVFHALGYRVNRSASLPFLVYRATPIGVNEQLKRGDCVLIDLDRLSNPVIEEGIRRGYVRRGEPMLKRIGAQPGDTVDLRDGKFFVNREFAAEVRIASRDSYGEKLSAWPTPLALPNGQYWLVSDPTRGFDSRYFGPVPRRAFTHKAKPLF